jgi:hypothetical protein
MNSTAQKICNEMDEAEAHETPVGAPDIEDLADRNAGEQVRWVSSTYKSYNLINIFICSALNERDSVILTRHSDGGVMVGWEGPWNTVKSAKKAVGKVPEGWLDIGTPPERPQS